MLGIFNPSINLGEKLTGLNPALLPRCFLCLYVPGNSSGFQNHVHTGRKLRWVELEFSVSRTNLGKKHTGLNPALLPRCFLCLDLPGNSSGFKKPSIQWEEFTPIHARDFSAQHKPGPEAHRLEPGASAQVFYVPGFTREFLGIKKPSVHWEEVTPGRTRDFSSQHKPGLEITWQQPSACAQVVPVPGFTRHYTSTMPPGNSRRRSYSWGLPGASRGVLTRTYSSTRSSGIRSVHNTKH